MGGSGGGDGGAAARAAAEAQARMYEMMLKQAEEARKAQYEAMISQQQQSANQLAYAGQNAAMEDLKRMNALQQAKDAAAIEAEKTQSAGAGSAATGGGFSLPAATKIASANLGYAAPYLNPAAQNNPAVQAANPAMTNVTGASTNKTTLPSLSGIQLGGY